MTPEADDGLRLNHDWRTSLAKGVRNAIGRGRSHGRRGREICGGSLVSRSGVLRLGWECCLVPPWGLIN